MTDIRDVLNERASRYGSFQDFVEISQGIQRVMLGYYDGLSDVHKEALEMIAHKMARILNGDPNYIDNWVDIAGYAQLVVDILKKNED